MNRAGRRVRIMCVLCVLWLLIYDRIKDRSNVLCRADIGSVGQWVNIMVGHMGTRDLSTHD